MQAQQSSGDISPSRKEEIYYKSLERLCKNAEAFKAQIKQLLDSRTEPLNLDKACWIVNIMVNTCTSIETCRELIAAVNLERNKKLLYPILKALSQEKPNDFPDIIKELAPHTYEERNDDEFKKTSECIANLISYCKDEASCQELLNFFPWDKANFEVYGGPFPLLHLLIEKNYQNTIRLLAKNLHIDTLKKEIE